MDKKIRTVTPVIAIIIVVRAVIITMIVEVIPVPNKIVTIDAPPITKMLSRVESQREIKVIDILKEKI